jgi:hypothetical protein
MRHRLARFAIGLTLLLTPALGIGARAHADLKVCATLSTPATGTVDPCVPVPDAPAPELPAIPGAPVPLP